MVKVNWRRHTNEFLVVQYHVCAAPDSSTFLMDVVPCTESAGNDFELIPTVKIKCGHPVEGPLVVSFHRSVSLGS